MGYKTGNVGYRESLLTTRSVIKKDNYAIITQDGLVANTVPGFENCQISILASGALGAYYTDFICEFLEGGKNELGFGGDGISTFVYVIDGKLNVSDGEETHELTSGGYAYFPYNKTMYFENAQDEMTEAYLYQRRYIPLEGHEPYKIVGNISQIESYPLEEMHDVALWDFLPIDDPAFDFNMHILSFEPGASHGFVETHYQEHGALVLEGKGMYNLDNNWYPVEKGDYIFMARYTPQCGYGVGRDRFTYIYSKDQWRYPEI